MLAMDESLGSLEELSENLHCELDKLDTRIDHAALIEYEMDMLRSQLAEKNRLVIFSKSCYIEYVTTIFFTDICTATNNKTASRFTELQS